MLTRSLAGCLSLLLAISSVNAVAEPRLWERPDAAIVIDAYWQNVIDFERLQKSPQVVGIIHKATEGETFKDCRYHERKKTAKALGYLWGSFHLGTSKSVERQVDAYLNYAQPEPDELVALDIEGVSKRDMSLENALVFADLLKQRLGRYPVLYVSKSVVDTIRPDQVEQFSRLPLWYVRFLDEPRGVPEKVWPEGFVLWQFASEYRRIYPVPGTDRNIDVNVAAANAEQLRKDWPFTIGHEKTAIAAVSDVLCP